MSSREAILANIRKGLKRGPLGAEALTALAQRQYAEPPLLPALAHADLVATFRKGLEKVAGTMAELARIEEVPAAVAAYLQEKGLPAAAAVAPALDHLDWASAGLSVHFGATRGADLTGVSRAWRGSAENGSLVLLSGPDNPTSLNFLPDHHLVVLARDDLVSHLEVVWAALRAQGGDWPRTVNVITGPSRTADIELTIQLGAHGPRSLHVLLVGPASEGPASEGPGSEGPGSEGSEPI